MRCDPKTFKCTGVPRPSTVATRDCSSIHYSTSEHIVKGISKCATNCDCDG